MSTQPTDKTHFAWRAVTLFSISVVVAITLDVLQKAETRRARVAVLYPAHSSRDFLFYEDTAANAGLNVKVFLDEAEAFAWLK